MNYLTTTLLLSVVAYLPGQGADLKQADPLAAVVIEGEKKKWHPITLVLDGPQSDENATPNPFLDYRFEVTFSHGNVSYSVPGYFAADGNAAQTSATSGNKWHARFTPDQTGTWTYDISFVSGASVALTSSGGTPTAQDGMTGTFQVAASDKAKPDLRARGLLRYTGEHYLRFDDGSHFIKTGVSSPENFLGFVDFDDTFALGIKYTKTYSDHVQDWKAGDPTWGGGKGKGIIGAVNYLSAEGVNSIYMLTLTDPGDTRDTWPYETSQEWFRFDVSKMAQWDIVFQHMQEKGMSAHLVLNDDQGEYTLDQDLSGDLGPQGKIYYRELIARFGYLNAIVWNLGEEVRAGWLSGTQLKSYVDYIASLDPYDHAIQLHNEPGYNNMRALYEPLLGYPNFSGISLQIHNGANQSGLLKSNTWLKEWREDSEAAGQKWTMAVDECCGYVTGIRPDDDGYNLDVVRKYDLWGGLMGGGYGMDAYFGGGPENRDFKTENFRPWAEWWAYQRHARAFFETYLPFDDMEPHDELTPDSEETFVLAQPGLFYAVYMLDGAGRTLDLTGEEGGYLVFWYNPRTGGGLQQGTVTQVASGGVVSLGAPPSDPDEDWVAFVRLDDPSLPVELSAFDAVLDGRAVQLRWTTTSESNNAGFEVERTVEGDAHAYTAYTDYASIGYVTGQGTTTDAHHYAFTDAAPVFAGGGATYRLKQVDFDGTFTYSEPVRVAAPAPEAYVLHANYPNPFNPVTTIEYEMPVEGPVRLRVYDTLGRVVETLIDRPQDAGRHRVTFEAGDLPSGLYVYRLEAGGTTRSRALMLAK